MKKIGWYLLAAGVIALFAVALEYWPMTIVWTVAIVVYLMAVLILGSVFQFVWELIEDRVKKIIKKK